MAMSTYSEQAHRILSTLTEAQLRFVAARLTARTDLAACRIAKVSRQAVSKRKREGVPINEVVRLLRLDAIEGARFKLEQAMLRAAGVVIEALDEDDDKRLRVKAAEVIFDRAGLPALARWEVKVSGTVDVELDWGDGTDPGTDAEAASRPE